MMAPNVNARQVTRVAGWSMVLSGLVYARAMGLRAPIPLAIALGCAAVATGMIVTLSFCLWLWARASGGMG